MADRVITYSILESWLNNQSLQPPVETIRDAVELLKEQSQCENCAIAIEDRQMVVRCKDCKHRDPEDKKCDCGHDIHWQLPRPDNWFCADGERAKTLNVGTTKMTKKQKEKFKQVILAKIDERERMGYDCLTDSDVKDILDELDRKRIPYTKEDLINVGLCKE